MSQLGHAEAIRTLDWMTDRTLELVEERDALRALLREIVTKFHAHDLPIEHCRCKACELWGRVHSALKESPK